MRQREYGGVPWYLMFTIAASVGAGILTYNVLRERERQLAEERARAPKPPPPPPAPKPAQREEPMPEAPTDPVPETPPEATGTVPVVTIQQAIVMGDLDEVGVEIRVAVQRQAIEECYQNAHGQGTIPFAMSVSLTGRVTAVNAVGVPFDKGLAACVATVLKRVRFTAPANAEPAEATVAIEFKRI